MNARDDQQKSVSRRRNFLKKTAKFTAAGALAGWLPLARISAAQAANCATPGNFPLDIPLYKQTFQNWAGDIKVDEVWTCAPTDAQQVVKVVNWARDNGYKVRPRGMMHNWSPLTVPAGAVCPSVILLDTTTHLTAASIDTSGPVPQVTAQAGISMEALLTALENAGLGLTATPAPGDLTLGGVLAINGHGTAVPAKNEQRPLGATYGSLSNLVLSLKAVVYDTVSRAYILKTFLRSDPETGALLAHVGRALIVEATLQVSPNQRLRCQSWTNIPYTEMFAPKGSGGRTFSSFLDSAGRAEAIWFPFTDHPWLKVWSVSPVKPAFARETTVPFNYTFSDNLPANLNDLAYKIATLGQGGMTPLFGQTQFTVVGGGLTFTGGWDLWGWSKNLLLYVKPTTLRITANGYAVLTRRDNVQRVLNEFATFYRARVAAYQALARYPMNGPVEIRVTGLDQPGDVAGANGVSPILSAIRPRPDHADWDVAIWLDILTFPGTPYANEFYREVEQWLEANYNGNDAAVRPEWSKGWGYSNQAAWADPIALQTTVPNAFRTGQPAGSNWDSAVAVLNKYDPHRLYSSALQDSLGL
ncbi:MULTISPECIES: cholesterol oxidase substrate-binding domain-containing protein [unclassified Janthinobacterium]|uniref:cholesterol oxidase substrate-binding domain-containing protein n=1 Tax=unclassified Janthinobacterium TaxID=2610881 RepID=UPI00160CBD93|nr:MULTISPECIES: cholesterol oxidase substrate-binding domain-containing protein [unclassified Janthinobacterium]MBB5371351.1 FAD/FMN-containing dehydrogenase [Janthinobacterium sp. K2C7]MBB5384157.1 FAD/FMN-containing dehydrogenase [Janthinobacterium sp. K2Li3]MBB5389383.1 FAD/FMN-containing dehydrogenase [Janthinobacterium sp. K2E3]